MAVKSRKGSGRGERLQGICKQMDQMEEKPAGGRLMGLYVVHVSFTRSI